MSGAGVWKSADAPGGRLAPLASPFKEAGVKAGLLFRLWLGACSAQIVVLLLAVNVLGGNGTGVVLLLLSIVAAGLFAVLTRNGRTTGLPILCVIATCLYLFLALLFVLVAVDGGSHASARMFIAAVAVLAALLAVAASVQTLRVHASQR